MTRSRHVTQASGGRTKHSAGARAVSESASMKLLASEDNGGDYRWAIVATACTTSSPTIGQTIP